MKKFFQEYRAELLLGALAVIGILLIVSRVEILTMLIGDLNQILNGTRATATRTGSLIDSFITSVSLFDLVGFVLLMAGMIFLLYRIWRRYLKSASWQGDECPKCKGDIHRIHRTRQDRLWGSLVRRPLRRYQCANPDCGWTGLLYGKPHEHHSDSGSSQVFQSVPKSIKFRK